jgi:crotonobetainyl-CoA:carnitine CoA-transferase CaiB-like acyl-CoA transferase
MSGNLSGVVVVAVEQAVAPPYASSRLADAGARVIKVERPEGDFARHYDRMVLGQSAHFIWLNRGKESVCLDLKTDADRELLERLIAKADVFIQNLRPGSMARLGLEQTELRSRYPGLIACDITGFGAAGEFSNLKAYDLIVQAEVGLCAITGNSAGPARVGVSVCDIAAGMTAHNAILQALFHRERTGEGSSIHVSLFDAVADWMNVPLLQLTYGNHKTIRAGVHHASLTPYGAYRCSDGKEVIFSVQNDGEWRGFCETFLLRPDLAASTRFADNTMRLAHRAELDEIICGRFAEVTRDQAMYMLSNAGLACGRLNELETVATHPQVRYLDIDTPSGRVKIVAPPALINGQGPELRPVASLGQHTRSIRSEFSAAPGSHYAPGSSSS